MKKFIYMVASLAFLTACHSTTTENKIESTQATAEEYFGVEGGNYAD